MDYKPTNQEMVTVNKMAQYLYEKNFPAYVSVCAVVATCLPSYTAPPEHTTTEDFRSALEIIDQYKDLPQFKESGCLYKAADYIRREWFHEEVTEHG